MLFKPSNHLRGIFEIFIKKQPENKHSWKLQRTCYFYFHFLALCFQPHSASLALTDAILDLQHFCKWIKQSKAAWLQSPRRHVFRGSWGISASATRQGWWCARQTYCWRTRGERTQSMTARWNHSLLPKYLHTVNLGM